ncbi:hypothetical protein BJX64DRAFT_245329 [Aspergillus heterothallicus]
MVARRFQRQRALDNLLNCAGEGDSGFDRSLVSQQRPVPTAQEGAVHPSPSVRIPVATRKEGTTTSPRIKERRLRNVLPREVKTAQTIISPDICKDSTIHFDMDVTDDIGAILEDFSRLKRLGYFEAAARYFDENLVEFMDILPVAIEYADMLLERGDYHGLDQFLRSYDSTLNEETWGDDNGYDILYEMNLQLMHSIASMHLGSDLQDAVIRVSETEERMKLHVKSRKVPVYQDSAEVQVFRYALMILSRVERETDLVSESLFDYFANCGRYYTALLSGGQIWDARDLICALIDSEGAINAWGIIFETDLLSYKAFNELFSDWDVGQYDQSTYLAILDILVYTSNSLSSVTFNIPTKADLAIAERCLGHARSVALCLKENNSELVHSRSYILWILAETQLQRKRRAVDSDMNSHLSAYPGLTVRINTLPVYLPIRAENPGWRSPSSPPDEATAFDSGLLEAAVETAKARGDYATEVACLSELIYFAGEGREIQKQRFSRMYDVQYRLQRDILNYQHTCLSRFLLTCNDEERSQLLSDLNDLQSSVPTGVDKVMSLTSLCMEVMNRALTFMTTASMAKRPSTYIIIESSHLPLYIKDKIADQRLAKSYNLEICYPPWTQYSKQLDIRSRSSERGVFLRPSERRRRSYERTRPTHTKSSVNISSAVSRRDASPDGLHIPDKGKGSDTSSDSDREPAESRLVRVSPPIMTRPQRVSSPEEPAHEDVGLLPPPRRRSTVEITNVNESEDDLE